MPRKTGTTWAIRAMMVPAVLMLGLTACGGGDDTADQASGNPGGAGAPGIAIGEPAPGTPSGEFLSTAVSDGGEPKKLVADTLISLTFADGGIRANAGCNTMSGDVTFKDGHIVVGDLAQTDMGCPGDGRHEQDTWLAKFLGESPAYTFDGKALDLKTETATIALKPKTDVVPNLPIEGTRWDVTHVTSGPAAGDNDPNAAVSAGMAPSKAYVQFDGGKVTGSDGCNRITGAATVKDDTITFGDIASTKMACPGVDTSGVRKVLQGTVSWKINTDVLTLQHPSGAGLQLSAHRNASDSPARCTEAAGPACDDTPGSPDEPSAVDPGSSSGNAGGPVVTPPCCKPLVGESGGATGSSGGGTAPSSVNPSGPVDPPAGY